MSGQFKVVKHEEAKIANRSTSKKDGIYSNISPADGKTGDAKAQRFKFDQLIAATENFKEDHFLGEGGFGKVYKGHLEDTGEVSSTPFCLNTYHSSLKSSIHNRII